MMDDPGRVAVVMKECHGRDITSYNAAFLINIIQARRTLCGLGANDLYHEYLLENKIEAAAFWDSLHITHSRFFREPLTYAVLEQYVFPEICSRKAGGSEIRVWSAGCACGQEAYSLAMLLLDHAQDMGREIRFRIYATDIDEQALEAGRAGRYHRETVAQVQAGRLARYFTEQGDYYTVTPALRKHVSFSTYDLLDDSSSHPPDSIYGDFDLVMCSNLLIYYTLHYQRIILNKLQKSLAQSGYLATGEAEKTLVGNELYQRMMSPSTAVFKAGKWKGVQP